MSWKGFIVESKSYMSYERMGKRERVRFWLRFPFSWFRFQWSGLTMRAVDDDLPKRLANPQPPNNA